MNEKSSNPLAVHHHQKNDSTPHEPLTLLRRAQTLDQKGIFAHQLEDIEDFIKEGESYPEVSSSIPSQIKTLIKRHFAVDASHIAIEESTKFLLPWEIACCIIEENGPPSIYTRPRQWFFRSIPQEAILSHELIHAFRGRLQSNIFEEHAAFDATLLLFPNQISTLRTWTGPLFTNAREALVTCILLFTVNLLPWFFNCCANTTLLLLSTAIIIAYPCLRCAFRWKKWNSAKKVLLNQFPNQTWKILIRLSDPEIDELSQLENSQATNFFKKKAQESWRWAMFTSEL